MNLYENTLRNEKIRLQTFENWPIPHIIKPTDLARAGFYYQNNGNNVTCVYCNGVIEKWESGDDPERKHLRHFPTCSFVQCVILPRLELHNVELPPDVEFDGEIQRQLYISLRGNAPNTDYDTFESRIHSFETWPKALAQTPESLAEAGFFYLRDGDAVECYSCGIILTDWEPHDDPWTEHARTSPKCNYVLLTKGKSFVKGCLDADLNNNENETNVQLSASLKTMPMHNFTISSSIERSKSEFNHFETSNGTEDTSKPMCFINLEEMNT